VMCDGVHSEGLGSAGLAPGTRGRRRVWAVWATAATTTAAAAATAGRITAYSGSYAAVANAVHAAANSTDELRCPGT
jgi:hypothetical protein